MKPGENQSLERILWSALAVSGADLLRGAQTGLIRIECGFAADSTMDTNRKIWFKILEFVMRRQNALTLPLDRGRQGLLQIQNFHAKRKYRSRQLR